MRDLKKAKHKVEQESRGIKMINKIKTLKLLAETKFLSLYDAEYENKAGKLKHWIIASRKKYDTLKKQCFEKQEDGLDAVVIAAFHETSLGIVMIKQYRVPLNEYVYELPAGLIDGNETIDDAVERELKEETGLTLIKINPQMGRDKAYLSPGMTDESAALVFCICEGDLSNGHLEEDEDIEAVIVSKEEAERLLKSKAKMDIKALMALQCFVKLGKNLFI